MATGFVHTDYLKRAMAAAEYDKLDDSSCAGRIPVCPGALSLGKTLLECEEERRSTLEDWLLVGLKLGHLLPILDGIDLNEEPRLEPLDAL
jgi:hypothetical protein